jgi:hypothetical protein
MKMFTLLGAVALVLSLVSAAQAQGDAAQSTTGTITAINPGVITVSATPGGATSRYAYNANTAYVNEAGSAVPIESIEPGVRVTVQYSSSGDRMLASKVILLGAGRTPGTTSEDPIVERPTLPDVSTVETALGRVTAVTPGEIMVRTEQSTRPETYAFTGATEFVDEAGAKKSLKDISPDHTVTVDFIRDGDRFIARRVVVRAISTPQAD